MRQVMVLFGEAEKGAFEFPYILQQLPQVVDLLGNPPPESEGLFYAVQGILYNREIIFFRVPEEGFSKFDYVNGLKSLESQVKDKRVNAICMPGVGDPEILSATKLLCHKHNSFLISSQKDLYDFLTTF